MTENDNQNGHPHISHWLSGAAIVAIGAVFLLDNLGFSWPFDWFGNWWALFILAGAIPSLEIAWSRYRRTGRIDGKVIDSLVIALAIITVAFIFLFNLAWNTWWPLFIIYAGIGMIARRGEPRSRRRDRRL